MDLPLSRRSSRRWWMYSMAPTSTPRVGWATMMTSGFSLNTRAMTTFCWLPPDRALHRSCTLGALMANSVRSCSANLRMAEASRRPRRAKAGRR